VLRNLEVVSIAHDFAGVVTYSREIVYGPVLVEAGALSIVAELLSQTLRSDLVVD
jgi:hypothetical protein